MWCAPYIWIGCKGLLGKPLHCGSATGTFTAFTQPCHPFCFGGWLPITRFLGLPLLRSKRCRKMNQIPKQFISEIAFLLKLTANHDRLHIDGKRFSTFTVLVMRHTVVVKKHVWTFSGTRTSRLVGVWTMLFFYRTYEPFIFHDFHLSTKAASMLQNLQIQQEALCFFLWHLFWWEAHFYVLKAM